MLGALRSRSFHLSSPSSSLLYQLCKLGFPGSDRTLASLTAESPAAAAAANNQRQGFLDLEEVENVLGDVRADDVKVIPVKQHCDWADYMVIATGRSTWHVKNIAQALIYKAKQKQKGARRMILPSVEGQEGGKWVVIDSGKVIIHALDEKARAYYNLENFWTLEESEKEPVQDLGSAFRKIRPKNNSKKPRQRSG
uniref:Protein Iojap-related n=1 Tax=Rhizophora mucronata TaxID=61149 RepID=A0A2P2Q5S6_RHIMU